MPTITGLVQTSFNRGSDGKGSDPEWDFTVVLAPSSIDGQPISSEPRTIKRRRVTPDVAKRTYAAIPRNAVVLLSIGQEPDGEVWRLLEILGSDPADDDRIRSLALDAAPARFDSDVTTDFEGNEYLVPNIWRRDPFELKGIGLVSPTYRVDTKLSLPTFMVEDFLTEPLAQGVFGTDGLRFSLADVVDELDLAGTAIANFCAGGIDLRGQATAPVYAYYQDFFGEFGPSESIPALTQPNEVWGLVDFKNRAASVLVEDDVAYILFEAECAWEPEHGLQIVFAGGTTVCKVSEYDGRPLHDDPAIIYQPAFS